MARPLCTIARDIKANWPTLSPHAKPYLDAMLELNSMEEHYYADDASTVVLYFLSNASGWRGPDAKRIKAELKAML